MKVAIACDHAGYDLKCTLMALLGDTYEWVDLGTNSGDSVDYPDFGHAMGQAIEEGAAQKGILICGTGIGISIAANRHSAVRAAVCTTATEARLTRAHNDANVLALGSRIVGLEIALACIDSFMNTSFEGGRHQRRIDKI